MRRRRGLRAALAAVVVASVVVPLSPAEPAVAGTVPSGFQEQIVFTGLTRPTNIEFAADGRAFVAEKGGRILVFGTSPTSTPTVFADLSTNVMNVWDRGLLGLALAPNFPSNPYVYVLYTYDIPPQGEPPLEASCADLNGGSCMATGRLSRLQSDASGTVMTGTEQVLIEDWCQQFPSHSIGDLHFGQDGMLYVTAGDGANFNTTDYGQLGNPVNPCGDPLNEGGALRSQDVRSPADPAGLNGALLRLNPATGAAAPGNPRIASADANERRIIAHGLRNPFRFAIKPGTDEVWVGDVGWNAREEINHVADPTGGVLNFGWPCYEGTPKMNAYDNTNKPLCETLYPSGGPEQTTPFFEFDRAAKVVAGETCPTGSSSVTGVALYPASGGNFPDAYRSALFFADYSRRCIWAMKSSSPGGMPSPSDIETFVAGAASPVDLAVGPGGDLYYVDHSGGTVRRIRYFAGNQPPVAAIDAVPTSGGAPLTVAFSAAGTVDPDPGDQGALQYRWDFNGDGSSDSTAVTATFTYATGDYTARLTVTDPFGATSSATVDIHAGSNAPTAFMDTPAIGTRWKVGDTITFNGHATGPQQASLPASAITWQLRIQHCSAPTTCHAHDIQSFAGVASGSFVAPDHEYPSYLELVMTATYTNLTSTVVRRLDPRTVNLTFASGPIGRQLSVGSETRTAPFTATFIQGSQVTITAPTPQTYGLATYKFNGWSDGGDETHEITAPTTATTYTAAFTTTGQPAPPPGLVAGYSFDAGSGTTATDISGNGNTGTISGGTWAAGKHGSALSFDGTSSRVQVPSSSSLTLSSGMTLAAWILPDSSQNGFRTIMQKEAAAYYLDASYPDHPFVPFAGGTFGGSTVSVNGPSASAVGPWTHLAVTYNGAILRLYVNGVEAAARPMTGLIQSTSSPLWIGGTSPYGQYFDGAIDDVQVFNRGLTAAEVQTIMNHPVGVGVQDSTAPSAPSALTARAVSATQVNLSWTASTDNVGVSGYLVERSLGPGCASWVQVATPTSTSLTDPGRSPYSLYCYRVRAADLVGNLSNYSNNVTVQTPRSIGPRKPLP